MSKSPSSGQQQSNSRSLNEIWNRVGHVEVIVWNGDKAHTYDFDGLDFKFSVTQILGRMPEGNMSVSICGLSQDTANRLVTLCSSHEALIKRKTLKLYAGYADPENDKYRGELLATMDIINATIISPPPDVWLHITAVYAGWLNDLKVAFDIMDIQSQGTLGSATVTDNPKLGTPYTFSSAQYVAIEQCLEEICNGLNKLQDARGVKVRYKYDLSGIAQKSENEYDDTAYYMTPGSTRHFTFLGTLADIPTRISETYKVNAIWEEREDNDIYLAVYNDPRYTKGMSKQDKSRFTRGKTIKFLDVDHGLIGIPKLRDSIKLECRCFLDGKIKAGDYVSVRSEMLPVIYEYGEPIKPSNKSLASNWGGSSWGRDENGNVKDEEKDTVKAYQIMRIKYTGHLRGNEWFCDIEARRPASVTSLTAEAKPRPILLTEDFAKKLKGWKLNEETGALTRPNAE